MAPSSLYPVLLLGFFSHNVDRHRGPASSLSFRINEEELGTCFPLFPGPINFFVSFFPRFREKEFRRRISAAFFPSLIVRERRHRRFTYFFFLLEISPRPQDRSFSASLSLTAEKRTSRSLSFPCAGRYRPTLSSIEGGMSRLRSIFFSPRPR